MLSAVLAVLLIAGGVTTAVLVMDRNEETQAEESEEERETEAERREREEQEAEEREAAQAHFDRCTEELDPLVQPLTDVQDQVGSGLDQLAFSGLLLDATLARILLDDPALGTGTCRDVSTRLKQALDTYNEALDDWRACIRDYSCDRTSPDSGVEEQWEQASGELQEAVDLLDTLDPESDDFTPDPEGAASSEGSGGSGPGFGGGDEEDPYDPDSGSDTDYNPFEPGERT